MYIRVCIFLYIYISRVSNSYISTAMKKICFPFEALSALWRIVLKRLVVVARTHEPRHFARSRRKRNEVRDRRQIVRNRAVPTILFRHAYFIDITRAMQFFQRNTRRLPGWSCGQENPYVKKRKIPQWQSRFVRSKSILAVKAKNTNAKRERTRRVGRSLFCGKPAMEKSRNGKPPSWRAGETRCVGETTQTARCRYLREAAWSGNIITLYTGRRKRVQNS